MIESILNLVNLLRHGERFDRLVDAFIASDEVLSDEEIREQEERAAR
jgi:hypothetical protein